MYLKEYPDFDKIKKEFEQGVLDKYKIYLGPIDYKEYDTIMFSQLWPSTALGFDSIGGSAMTKAYTTILVVTYVIDDSNNGIIYGVFFGDRLAYLVKDPTKEFFKDLEKREMKRVRDSGVYSYE